MGAVIFTVEYILMLWSSVADPLFGSRGPVCGRVRAALRPLALVDLLAIAPFYLGSFIHVDLRFIWVLRLFRIFRLFRSAKMTKAAQVMWTVILSSWEQLTLSLPILIVVVLLVSSVMYIVEQDWPGTKFTSIPASMWWSIITITTIGYGDVVPDSPAGKVFASFVVFLGICVFAIPVGIIGSGFVKYADESSTDGRAVPQVPSESIANGSGNRASTDEHPSTVQQRPLSDLEMSAVSLLTIDAEEANHSAFETWLAGECSVKGGKACSSLPVESQRSTNRIEACPQRIAAVDPDEQGDAPNKMNFYSKVQWIVYETVAEPPEDYFMGKFYGSAILAFISVNIVASILETIPSLENKRFFYYFEFASVIIFTVDYVLMLWSSVANPQFGSRGPVCGRVRAAMCPLAVVDLLAIAPFYLSSFIQMDLRFIRVLRLFKIFRLFRSGKMAKSAKLLAKSILANWHQMTLGILLLVVIVLLVSSVMFIIEQGQPDTNFTSIPATMWWGVVTITTIGYGDMVPASTAGKIFASFASFLAICLCSLPVGIIAEGFNRHSTLATESDTYDGTQMQVSPDTIAGDRDSDAASSNCPPAAQTRQSSDLEMSAASLLTFAAKEPLKSVTETQSTVFTPHLTESQSPNREEACPPTLDSTNSHEKREPAEKMKCYSKAQQTVYETVVEPPGNYLLGKMYISSILTLISVNIVCGVLETVPSLFMKYENFFSYFEFASVVIFTIDYVLMLWSSVADPQFGSQGPLCGRVRAATCPLALVDIIAIAPFYLSLFVKTDLRFIRILRLFRIFRLFRFGKMAESAEAIVSVILTHWEELTLSLLMFIVILLLVSSAMFIIEHDQINTKFTSIPASMWWGITTLTTIGYGDMVPNSSFGKSFASLVGFVGICVFAMFIGVIGAGFAKHDGADGGENHTPAPRRLSSSRLGTPSLRKGSFRRQPTAETVAI